MFSSFVVSVYVIGTFTVLVRLALSGTVGVLCWVPLFSICAVALFCTLSSEACSFSLAASVTGDGFVSLWLRGPGLRLQSLSVSTYERSFDLYHIWAIGQLLSYLTASQVLLCCPATMTSCPISSSGTEYDGASIVVTRGATIVNPLFWRGTLAAAVDLHLWSMKVVFTHLFYHHN